MRLFFLLEQSFEALDLELHIRVDFEVARNNLFHSVNVLVDVSVAAVAPFL